MLSASCDDPSISPAAGRRNEEVGAQSLLLRVAGDECAEVAEARYTLPKSTRVSMRAETVLRRSCSVVLAGSICARYLGVLHEARGCLQRTAGRGLAAARPRPLPEKSRRSAHPARPPLPWRRRE